MRPLHLQPLNGTLGATLTDVDLCADDAATMCAISDALQQHRVLVVPDQQALDPQDLLAFAERFGEAERVAHPIWADVPGHVGVKRIATGHYPTGVDVGDSWHTDGPPREKTQWFTFLQAIDVPPFGRDTLFADMVGALSRLSPALREFLETLTAWNSWGAAKPDAEPVVLSGRDDGPGRPASSRSMSTSSTPRAFANCAKTKATCCSAICFDRRPCRSCNSG